MRARVLVSRVFFGGLASAMALVLLPVPALATITGDCTGTGTTASGGSVDFKTASVWHVKNADVLSGTGESKVVQTEGSAWVEAFGVKAVTVADGHGKGTSGGASGVKVADYSKYTRVIAAAGKSDSCSGDILIVVDDVSPLGTVGGLAGVAGAVVGGLGLLGTMFGRGGGGGRIGGAVLGLIGGTGVSLLAQEAGAIDPRSILGLGVVVAGGVLGLVVPGLLHRGPKPPA